VSESCRKLLLGSSGKVALVDPGDFARRLGALWISPPA
jgi:hypothetical protein